MPTVRRGENVPWHAFVVASVLLAITAGFGLGGFLMAVEARGAVNGPWWEAATQAHGHIQVFGWAGLMVLGVGLHVLPRLRGTPLAHAAWARPACVLLVGGLVVRAIGQPAFAATDGGSLHTFLGAALIGSGILELGGGSLVAWMLGRTAWHGPRLSTRPALMPLLPFFGTAFAALWVALVVNLIGLIGAVRLGGVIPDGIDDLTTWIGFYAFLLPVSLAMSARTFPIFLRTALPRLCVLQGALAVLIGGLALRVVGDLSGSALAAGVGRLLLASALLVAILALGVFGRRRPLPRQATPLLTDPIRVQMFSAYLWLVVVSVLLILAGLKALDVIPLVADVDAERHALGAGFITLLIVGVGAFLLPGMTGRRRLSAGLLWATGLCANGAAMLRVVPTVAPGLGSSAPLVMAISGVVGIAALALFGVNVVIGRFPTVR